MRDLNNRREVKREGGRRYAGEIAGLGLCRATRIGHALRVGTTRGPGDAVARRHAPGEKGASGCAAVRPDKDKQGI